MQNKDVGGGEGGEGGREEAGRKINKGEIKNEC